MSAQEEELGDAVWIRTEPSANGKTYVVTLEINEDTAVILTPLKAMAYVAEVTRVVARVEYEAAVVHQMKALLEPTHGEKAMELVAQVIHDLRGSRPPINDNATKPLIFGGGVSSATGKGFITLAFASKPQVVKGQWEIEAAGRHILAVLHAVESANLDAEYFRVLVGMIGLDGHVARNVIDDLRHHREGHEDE